MQLLMMMMRSVNRLGMSNLPLLAMLIGLGVALSSTPRVAAHESFPEGTVFLHVAHDGAEYKSLDAALKKAHTLDAPVAIHIAAGTYREGDLRVMRREAPLWILGDENGGTIVSGSDVWTDWTERDGKLVAHWPHDWGNFVFNDPRWLDADRKTFRPAGARSESVFVDGHRLTQVITAEEMHPGAFRVDLEADELIVELPEGANADTVLIEVGIRQNLITMLQPKDVTMRHLTFQHNTSHIRSEGSGQFDPWGVSIFGEHKTSLSNAEANPNRIFAENITIEHCKFLNNSKSGLTLANAKNVVIRHCNFDENGYLGVGANRCRNVLIEDSTFNRNAWRLGKLGHAAASLPAGTKMLFMYELTFRRCQINDNYSAGLWFDTSVNFLVVEDSEMRGNWDVGFYYEHCQGPALLKNSVVAENGYNDGSRVVPIHVAGVLFAESEHLTIDNCDIYDNIHIQVGVRSLDRPGSCYWTGRFIDGSSRHLALVNNRIRGASYEGQNVQEFFTPAHRLSTLVGRQVHAKEDLYMRDFPSTYVASGNRYYNPVSEDVFATGPVWGHERVTLQEWQDLTGQDAGSTWGEWE